MTWKIALAPLLTLAVALTRCGDDPCSSADVVLAKCAPHGEIISLDAGMTPACEGTYLCTSQCANQATCSQITDNDPAYTTCVTQCYAE